MTKAVLRNGVIYPLEPLPTEWKDGQELYIASAEGKNGQEPLPDEIDRDFQELAALCAAGDADDDARLVQALEEAHRLAKEQVRKQMGLKG